MSLPYLCLTSQLPCASIPESEIKQIVATSVNTPRSPHPPLDLFLYTIIFQTISSQSRTVGVLPSNCHTDFIIIKVEQDTRINSVYAASALKELSSWK